MREDRRVQRTQELLKTAMMELVAEKGYDAVTVQDVTARANVGRTTFYLHFRSKADLFLRSHMLPLRPFQFGPFSREELLADEPPPVLSKAFSYALEYRSMFRDVNLSHDGNSIWRAIKEVAADIFEQSLRAAFDEKESRVPFRVLAAYLAGSQFSLMDWWWVDNLAAYTPEEMARTVHRLQRAAIQEALGLKDRER
jgi:AcrR family transcriptional regulator